MNIQLFKKVFLIASLALFAGCSIEVKDLTPPEFPLHDGNEVLSVMNEALYPGSTPQQYADLAQRPAHRFILEVKPKAVTNIQAYIIVNGTQHAMDGSGSGLWTYESENNCQASYSYYYEVKYKVGPSYSQKSKSLGSESEMFTTTVASFGEPVWYEALMAPNPHDGEVRFVQNDKQTAIIYVQNLRETAISVFSIALSQRAGITDNDQFEVTAVPQLPMQLDCGDTLSFQVKWSPETTPATATGALGIWVNPTGDAAWIILLKGMPQPG